MVPSRRELLHDSAERTYKLYWMWLGNPELRKSVKHEESTFVSEYLDEETRVTMAAICGV